MERQVLLCGCQEQQMHCSGLPSPQRPFCAANPPKHSLQPGLSPPRASPLVHHTGAVPMARRRHRTPVLLHLQQSPRRYNRPWDAPNPTAELLRSSLLVYYCTIILYFYITVSQDASRYTQHTNSINIQQLLSGSGRTALPSSAERGDGARPEHRTRPPQSPGLQKTTRTNATKPGLQ